MTKTHYCPRCMMGGFENVFDVRMHLIRDHKRTLTQAADLVNAHDLTQPLPTRKAVEPDPDDYGMYPMGFCI